MSLTQKLWSVVQEEEQQAILWEAARGPAVLWLPEGLPGSIWNTSASPWPELAAVPQLTSGGGGWQN